MIDVVVLFKRNVVKCKFGAMEKISNWLSDEDIFHHLIPGWQFQGRLLRYGVELRIGMIDCWVLRAVSNKLSDMNLWMPVLMGSSIPILKPISSSQVLSPLSVGVLVVVLELAKLPDELRPDQDVHVVEQEGEEEPVPVGRPLGDGPLDLLHTVHVPQDEVSDLRWDHSDHPTGSEFVLMRSLIVTGRYQLPKMSDLVSDFM